MRIVRRSAVFVALAATLAVGVAPALAAVTYTLTINLSLGDTGDLTFSQAQSDFLTVGETLTYGLGDITPESGAVNTYTNPLVLTQTAAGITSDTADLTFNPALGDIGAPLGGAISITGLFIGPAACLVDTPCNQTGTATGFVVFENQGTDSRQGPYSLVVSGFPDEEPPVNGVPEPTSLALCASGLVGLAGYALRRRARRDSDIG